MRLQKFSTIGVFAYLLACSIPSVQGAERERESIAVVLAGGGARGIAHVGVLQALEELQVPIDAIAGTSMGALVGGLYATGMDAAELETVVSDMDWESAFNDSIPRSEQPIRRKADDYDYPIKVNMAIKEGDLSFPLGLIQGQQVRMIIKDLMVDADHIRDFDELPIPYRAVATDLETGDAYIFESGEMVTAMRASMSMPGLLTPVEHDGLLLVDGGVANNVPVNVAREMGAERLIVIDVGTPLKSREEIQSVVGVADQMLGFLTRKNSLEQLATLEPSDFLIRPDLGSLGMLDFDDEKSIVEKGYQATMAMQDQLKSLQLDDGEWAAYLDTKILFTPATPVIEFIAIKNDSPIADEIIQVRISQKVGEVLDRDQLRRDIADIYALDYFEIIDFHVVDAAGRTGLQIKATEKTWGSDDIKLGLNMVTDLEGASEINMGGSYRLKGLNRKGAEFYGRAQLGDTILLSGEFYQPVDIGSHFFIAPRLAYHDREILTLGPEFDLDEAFGNWRVRDLQMEFNIGTNVFKSSELRLGLFRGWGESDVKISSSDLIEDGSFDKGGVLASWRYDNMDEIFFPRRGGFLYAEYEANLEDMGADQDFERWQVLAQAAFSFGADDRNTVIITGKTAQSEDAANEPQNYYQLGGLFNMSGLQQDALSGRQMAFAMAQYQRRLSENSVIPLDMPVYAGFSLEGGQLASTRSELDFGDMKGAGSIYLAIDSPIGPLYLAYGQTSDSRSAVYIALGWPFLGQNTRIGR
ncbi:MAG: patatin-like phospholipase family protein [Halioglobus sp.]